MLLLKQLITILALASAYTIKLDANKYPVYCAKDMDANRIQPLKKNDRHENLRLVQVQMVVRHGARTPHSPVQCWDGYDETWNCNIRDYLQPTLKGSSNNRRVRQFEKIYVEGKNTLRGNCTLGQMIDEGYRQQEVNAEHLAEAYIGDDPLKLFRPWERIDVTNTTEYHFESTDLPRTVQSGQIIVGNMLRSISIPIENGENHAIPFFTQDFDASWTYPNYKLCPRLKQVEKEWHQTPAFQAWNSSTSAEAIDTELRAHISNWDRHTLHDCLITSRCTDRKLPKGMSDDLFMRTVSREAFYHKEQFLYNNASLSKAAIAHYTQILRERMINFTKVQSPRFVVSAGHDTTIMPLLAAFGGDAWLTEWAPYASHLIFELYEKASSSSSLQLPEYFVRILYQGKPKSFCDDEICPLADFIQLTAFADKPDMCQEIMHAHEESIKEDNVSSSAVTSSWCSMMTVLYVIVAVFSLL